MLIRLESFSGEMASLYTVMVEVPGGAITTKLDQFFEKYRDIYPSALIDIARRLKSLGNTTGCTENFFKLDEGLDPDDLVCALYDVPDIYLRLYGIRLSDQITKIRNGDLRISGDGLRLEGDLWITRTSMQQRTATKTDHDKQADA